MSCEECFDEQSYLYNRVMTLERLCGELNASLLQAQLSTQLCRCQAGDMRRFKTCVYDHENGRALVTYVQDLKRCDTGEPAGIVSPDGSWTYNEPQRSTVERQAAVHLEELQLMSSSDEDDEADEESEVTPDHTYSTPPPPPYNEDDRRAFLDSAKALHMAERLHAMTSADAGAKAAKCLGVPLQVIIILLFISYFIIFILDLKLF